MSGAGVHPSRSNSSLRRVLPRRVPEAPERRGADGDGTLLTRRGRPVRREGRAESAHQVKMGCFLAGPAWQNGLALAESSLPALVPTRAAPRAGRKMPGGLSPDPADSPQRRDGDRAVGHADETGLRERRSARGSRGGRPDDAGGGGDAAALTGEARATGLARREPGPGRGRAPFGGFTIDSTAFVRRPAIRSSVRGPRPRGRWRSLVQHQTVVLATFSAVRRDSLQRLGQSPPTVTARSGRRRSDERLPKIRSPRPSLCRPR